jgi:hypothetical protein
LAKWVYSYMQQFPPGSELRPVTPDREVL